MTGVRAESGLQVTAIGASTPAGARTPIASYALGTSCEHRAPVPLARTPDLPFVVPLPNRADDRTPSFDIR